MNFEKTVLKTIVEKLKLRRMRFKVDPAISNLEDFDGNTSYEGYVLNENDGVLNILVVDPNNQVRQTALFAKGVDILSDNLNNFKKSIIRFLIQKAPEQTLVQIQNASTFDEVEQIAKNNGANDDDIKNAYRTVNNESIVNEQGLLRRTIGKTADITKDVLFGKERKPGIKGATGIFGLGTRIGSTLSKLGTKGKGDFQFTQRSSIYHKDRPRLGQRVNISLEKDGVRHSITGKIGGDTVSGNDSYINVYDVNSDPPLPNYKIKKLLMDFDLNNPSANFYIYDANNKYADSFSGKINYAGGKWNVEDTAKAMTQVKTGAGKAKGDKSVANSAKNMKAYADAKGYDVYKEPNSNRILFKIKDEDIFFDSNYNRQTPKTKP